MPKIKLFIVGAGIILTFMGCSTVGDKYPFSVDQKAEDFFNYLRKSDRQGAYSLFSKELSKTISYNQFDSFLGCIQNQWGKIKSEEIVFMPFHEREEGELIPLHIAQDQIKRYTFDVKFENAEVNCDLTLAPEDRLYKIIWFSFWGDDSDLTPEIREKAKELFPYHSGPG